MQDIYDYSVRYDETIEIYKNDQLVKVLDDDESESFIDEMNSLYDQHDPGDPEWVELIKAYTQFPTEYDEGIDLI